MNYEETLDYLYAKLPMYQRIGNAAFKKDLTNIIQLCDALGNPQNQFKSIHIAGTNGKGSTCHMLSAIYQQNGYKTGLYTSPHLIDFRERIKLNGQLCPKHFVIDFVAKHQKLIEEIQPSFFEITVAMAFAYFAEEKVDVAIIETGLGGRLDSTNIVQPIGTGITSIGYDHMDMLGDTIEKIAAEKAGIIKHTIPLVIGSLPKEAEDVIRDIAADKMADVHPYLQQEVTTDIPGTIQQQNACFALSLVSVLQTHLHTKQHVNYEALLNVAELSGLQGRWQVLSENPHIICDVAHNEEGISHLVKELNERGLNTYFILGFVNEKSLETIVSLFPQNNHYYFVKPSIQRGRPAEEVLKYFKNTHPNSRAFESLTPALNQAILDSKNDSKSVVLVGGSNFLVADLLLLNAQNQLPI